MKTNLLEISKAYREYLQKQEPARSEPCPDIELLMECCLAGGSKRKRARVIEHAANCANCSQTLKKILELSQRIDAFAEEARPYVKNLKRQRLFDRIVAWSWISKRVPAAITAALIGVVILGLLALKTTTHFSTRDVSTNLLINLVSPVNTVLTMEDIQFKWERIARTKHYIVELFDKSLGLIWRSDPILDNTATYSGGDQKLGPGKNFYWMVTAVMEDDRKIRSKLAEFSIK